MKNILLVFTGGTIGSTTENGTINTTDQARYNLLALFRQQYPEHQSCHFKILQPLQILSENLQAPVWEHLIKVIEAENLSDFDGVIITHGTDTLAYSAAALGLYFNHLKIPMLLVSSNYPVDHLKANGLDNFVCGVEYIRKENPAGVFVPYKNPKQIQQVHIATRLASSLQLSGNFLSVQSRIYMQFEQGKFSQFQQIDSTSCVKTILKPDFSKKVLLVKPYPGLDYSSIQLDNIDAVLHDLYHSGTACVSTESGKQYSLLEFNKTCKKQKVRLYMAPAVKHDVAYKSSRELMEQGIEMIWNMSLESAYVKLLLAYGNFSDNYNNISTFLQNDISFEHI